jgi:hypothetical protein
MRGGGDRLVFGAPQSTEEVTGGGMRGDGGELYLGSSWSRACGSSKDLRNLGGGENDPSTEFSNDMLWFPRETGNQGSKDTGARVWNVGVCIQVS